MDPMQGPPNTRNPSTEVIDVDEQQQISSTNSETSLNNMANPVDSPFPNYSTPPGWSTFRRSGWSSFGESSSGLGPFHQANDVRLNTGHQIAPGGVRSQVGYGWEEGISGSTGLMSPGDSHVQNGLSFLQGTSSTRLFPNVNLSIDVDNNGNGGQSSGVVLRHDNCGSSWGSSSRVGEESSSGPGSSLGGWNSSCKRKTLEGASGHSFYAESHTNLTQNDASSGLSLSIPSQSSPNIINQSGQSEPRFGAGGGRVVASNGFPSTRNIYSSSRPGRLYPGQPQDTVPFSLLSAESSLRPNDSLQQHLPVTSPIFDHLDLRSTTSTAGNFSNTESQSNIVHLPALTRNIHHFVGNAASSSRPNNSLSILIPGGQFGPPRDPPRSNSEHHMFGSSNEMRIPMQDQSLWSHVNNSVSGDPPFVRRAGPSSTSIHSLQPNAIWIPPRNGLMDNPQSLFSDVESESARPGGSLPLLRLPTGPFVPSNEPAVPSGSSSRSRRPRPRRSGLSLERQNDVVHLRQLGRSLAADNNGRGRLISEIRQVLNVMRRGGNLRVEDYMVFDPNPFLALDEMNDRHQDLRLDVDNMSYEELLALEERIGDVSTGLSEELILKALKQHKYISSADESQQDAEPCCICQEEYAEGDDLGTLDCGHDFHTDCIKQWVMLKNICPICKTMALST